MEQARSSISDVFDVLMDLRLVELQRRELCINYNISHTILLADNRRKRTLLNNILIRKANWIGHILRRNHLHHDTIEGEIEGVGRRRRRRRRRRRI